MAEVKILVEGYTNEESGEEKTGPTITLVKDKDIVEFHIRWLILFICFFL